MYVVQLLRRFPLLVALSLPLGCGRTTVLQIDGVDPPLPEICANGQDDDGDGLTDCDDPDCSAEPRCNVEDRELCGNNVDDDGDGLVDCDDPDCLFAPGCGPSSEACANNVDDDGDGLIDCDDPDCQGDPLCAPGGEVCTNNIDDDGDNLVDCRDPDCFKHPSCRIPGAEVCNNGIDDDEDTAVDCDDPDCFGLPICQPGQEVCNNEVDDDGDGAVDCDDPDCVNDPGCITAKCQPDVDFGVIAAKGGSATRTVDTRGKNDVHQSPCAVPGGGEIITSFELAGDADVKLEYEQLSGDHAFGLFRAGVGESCAANPRSCHDPDSQAKGSFTMHGLQAGAYYLFVEAFAGGLEGQVTVTLTTGSVVVPEQCGNGIDDDGDGATDCADLDCVNTPICIPQICGVDVNVGTLVMDGPPKFATVDTSGGGDDVSEACAAGGGGDRVLRFVMPGAGGVSVEVQQSGWHVLGMHESAGPGTVCTADSGNCFDSNDSPAFLLQYGSMGKGVYYYVVDALEPGREGAVSLSFRAFSNRGPELCANEIDDDGDGLADCKDPDCAGVVGCPGPVCQPDLKAGALAPGGQSVQLKADTTSANNSQTVPCALGGGKDVVIELVLTSVSGLFVSCSQTGDHVLGLFSAGQPRDPCDASPTNCADLKTGSLGCDFIFPNLQPGRYFLVAEAFKPGAEGVVDLLVAAVPDHAQEICNNNVDDDGDGKVDCQDSNCSTQPICQGQTCVPDQDIGLIAVGTAPANVAVTTTGQGDSNSAGCAMGGGEDAVVTFKVVQAVDLEVTFAQLGNHVLALYDDKGIGYACDAAPRACEATSGANFGTLTFPALPPGEYHLVVEAVSAGAEGSVGLQISAKK